MTHRVRETARMAKALSYKPSAFYYRHELRKTRTKAEAVRIGMALVSEVEKHKQWIRERGMVPPKWLIMPTERAEKDWGSVVPFPSTVSEFETGA